MNPLLRYWGAGRRRIQTWRYRLASWRSPQPLAELDRAYATLCFDYEGQWSRADQAENSRKGVDNILRTLGDAGLRATFNCVGRLIEDQREVLELIREAGHEIASHTVGHTRVDGWPAARVAEDMERFRALLSPVEPTVVGFRAPQSRWRTETLQGLLQSGVLWDAADDESPFPYVVARRDGRRLWRMPVALDDWDLEGRGLGPHAMLAAWREAIRSAATQRHFVAVGFHPWVLGKDPSRLDAFDEFVEFVRGHDGPAVATFGEVARLCESRMKEAYPR